MKLKVRCYKDYYIGGIGGKGWYLWHDGTIHNVAYDIKANKLDEGYWTSKQEAQQFLDDWLPQKDWITQEQVKQAAEHSDEMALMCSLNHWKQMLLAGKDKYFVGVYEEKVNHTQDYCALCKRHKSERNCPLEKNCDSHCVPEYRDWSRPTWEEGHIRMLNKLQETYNKLYIDAKDVPNGEALFWCDSGGVYWNDKKVVNFKGKKMKEIEIKGKKFSEETIVEALKAHVGFEETYQFKAGDVCINDFGDKRIICKSNSASELVSFNSEGKAQSVGQSGFELMGYEKIGELKDFLK